MRTGSERAWRSRDALLVIVTSCLFCMPRPVVAQTGAPQAPYYLGAHEIEIGWTPGESPASAAQEVQDISTVEILVVIIFIMNIKQSIADI